MSNQLPRTFLLAVLVCLFCCESTSAQTTAFTYQGKLTDAGAAASGSYQMQFSLHSAASGDGNQIGSTITIDPVSATNGTFTVELNFTATNAFDGSARWLQIALKKPTDPSFVPLSPRQPITSTPYAQRSLSAESIFIGGNRAFAVTGGLSSPNSASNTFAGVDVGASNVPSDLTNAGNANSFFGRSAGRANTDGSNNSFFGFRAGYNNTSGHNNAFFGAHAGLSNTTEAYNTFLGNQTTGAPGVIFGTAIGAFAKVERSNSIVLGSINGVNGGISDTNVGIGTTNPTERLHVVGNGLFTGNLTVNGTLNATLPANSGNYIQNQTGSAQAAGFNINGSGLIGGNVGIGTDPSHKLHVVDSGNTGLRVQTNTVGGTVASFGGNGEFGVDAPARPGGRLIIKENGNVGIGTTQPTAVLHVRGAQPADNSNANAPEVLRIIGGQGADNTTTGNGASSGGGVFIQAGGTGGGSPLAFGGTITLQPGLASNPLRNGTLLLAPDGGNVGIGITSPGTKLHIADNAGQLLFGGGGCGAGHVGFGFASSLTCANYSVLGNGTHTFINRPPGGAIFFRENNADQLIISAGGTVTLNTLGSAGGTQLCRNLSNQISNCSSSLRYKTNIAPFTSGLSFVHQLRPVTFDWKAGGRRDVGFGAEDVAKINPLFVTYNDKGEIEGVNYDRLSVVFVNALREQQSQIEQQQKEIEALKKLICATNANADVCKPKGQ